MIASNLAFLLLALLLILKFINNKTNIHSVLKYHLFHACLDFILVMTVHLGLLFFTLPPFSPLCRGCFPYELCTSLFPYLLHALPSLLLYHLRVHQYLLMHNLYAPFVPASPRRYLMYHCTDSAHFLPLLHVYYHAPYACLCYDFSLSLPRLKTGPTYEPRTTTETLIYDR